MDYGGNHVLRTVSDSQPAVTGIDRSMSIINMLRFPLCTCWLCVNYFELYMLLSNLYAHLYILCIDFILTYVTGNSDAYLLGKRGLNKFLEAPNK